MKSVRSVGIAPFIVFFLYTAQVFGQAGASQKSVDDLTQSVAKIASSVATLTEEVKQLKTQCATKEEAKPKATQVSDLEQMRRDLRSIADVASANTSLIGELKKDFVEATNVLNNTITTHQQILEAISVRSSDNNYVPRISGNLSDPDFKKDFQNAMQVASPKQATLVVINKTDRNEEIVVNGKQVSVMSGASREFEVPVGYSTLRLDGEKPVRWYVGAPTYKQQVAIEDEPAPTPAPIAISPPIIYDDWWWPYYYATPWTPVATSTTPLGR